MYYWVIADKGSRHRIMMGPYNTYSRALSIKDGLDDGHSSVEETESGKREVAVREIRHKRVKEEGSVDEAYKNFRHK